MRQWRVLKTARTHGAGGLARAGRAPVWRAHIMGGKAGARLLIDNRARRPDSQWARVVVVFGRRHERAAPIGRGTHAAAHAISHTHTHT